MFHIIEERLSDEDAVKTLARLALCNRMTDSPAARLRAAGEPIAGLSLVALENENLVGTIRFWPVLIGAGAKAVQLGPVAIEPSHRGRGISRLLIRYGLERAQAQGHRIVVLIGDHAIYERYGFLPAAQLGITLAEYEDRDRLQVLSLAPGAIDGLRGCVRPDDTYDANDRRVRLA